MKIFVKGKWSGWSVPVFLLPVLMISIFLSACAAGNQPVNDTGKEALAHVSKDRLRAENRWNREMIDSAVGQLHSGDLLMRTGNDVTSYMLSQINQVNKTYSHCGLVMIENGYPFVYHSIGGEDNPNERMRRDSASFFISAYHNLGFGIARFDFRDSTLSNLTGIVHEYYRKKPLFDMDFDLQTDDKLYCAEFIYKAITGATKDSNYIKPTALLGYRFVGVDDIFLSPHAKTIWQVRYK
jgi:hypothetical protein